MRAELTLSLGTLMGFLFCLTRVAGIFVFVPVPGLRSGPGMARIVLALVLAVAMFPHWPAANVGDLSIGWLTSCLLIEAAIGAAVGLAVGFLLEAFSLAAQAMGLQAGYAYASTIDPMTQADSGVLLIFAQLFAGLLFFASGLDRELMRALIFSLDVHPPGAFALSTGGSWGIVRLGSGMFETGLRLALPLIALLALVDIALALLGRINAHLQLLTLAFPAKMIATLVVLAALAALYPIVFEGWSRSTTGAIRALLTR